MRPLSTLTFAMLAAMTASCTPSAGPASAPPATPPGAGTVVVYDTVRIAAESAADTEMEEQIARLQIQLLEREVRIGGLTEQLDAARQEVVRTMAKLQSQATRAEAASGMAEAEIALEALGRSSSGRGLLEFTQAQSLIDESSAEFGAENYGGALYLAAQARTLARTGQSRLRGATGAALQPGESLFMVPVPLRTVGRANVRGGPGLDQTVLFTLEADASVVGQSYTSQWVRVVDVGGREGWVFHTLVSASPN